MAAVLQVPQHLNSLTTNQLQVWVAAELDPATGRLRFSGDSDSELTKGLCSILVEGLSGLTPEEVLQVRRACGWRDTTGKSTRARSLGSRRCIGKARQEANAMLSRSSLPSCSA